MSSLMTIKLNKHQGMSWGFRLQGGKDFATPLCIQKVNVGSVAEKAGLAAGDAVVSIGGQDALNFRHKEAQDTIVRSGNSFDLVIQRGMQTWRPTVSVLPQVKSTPEGVFATSTSLAATPQMNYNIGSGHNTTAAPFLEGPDKQHLVNAQFNSPINLYSEDSIAETLSAQAEILGQGVLGINFKKYAREEKIRTDSPTYKLLHGEEDDTPPKHRPARNDLGPQEPFQNDPVAQQGPQVPFPSQSFSPVGGPTAAQLQPGENICFGCQRLIIGVFVRIKNKNLHAECFKCATCGSSLKNVGYYNINEKLYCDIHAKQAARHNPPAPNMVPITVQPGQVPPTGAMTSPQARVSSPFQPKSPVPAPALAPMQAPASAPAPVLPEPIMQELPTPESVHVPEPQLPDPLPEPQPIVEVSEEMPTLPEELEPVHVQEVRAPALAPSVPKPSPIAPAPVVVPNLQTSVNPQAFGALAGGVDVRSHIPKKGNVNATYQPKPEGVLPTCHSCQDTIRGPFISALGKTWCPDHFICATETCRRAIIEMGFVEEQGRLYCENCYESYLAPICGKCDKRIKGDCLNAVGKQFHPECFCCAYCGKVFGSGAFYLEDGLPYCETDWNDLFTTKCVGCNFPIEAGDRWVEALNSNYHSQCFKCSKCHKNLEGQSFFAKGGKPFCKAHAQRGF